MGGCSREPAGAATVIYVEITQRARLSAMERGFRPSGKSWLRREARCCLRRETSRPAPTISTKRPTILDAHPNGGVAPLGDNAYVNGSAEGCANCYHPTWGRHFNRTKPAPGNHEYQTPGAAGYYEYSARRRAILPRDTTATTSAPGTS